jgi:hypothetical protein
VRSLHHESRSILNRKREISGDYHAAAGKAWREKGEKKLYYIRGYKKRK